MSDSRLLLLAQELRPQHDVLVLFGSGLHIFESERSTLWCEIVPVAIAVQPVGVTHIQSVLPPVLGIPHALGLDVVANGVVVVRSMQLHVSDIG